MHGPLARAQGPPRLLAPGRWIAVALSVCVLPLVAAGAPTGASRPAPKAAEPFGDYLKVIGHPPGHYVLFDLTLGRTMIVPDGTGPEPPRMRATGEDPEPEPSVSASIGAGGEQEQEEARAEQQSGMPAHKRERGWDTWLSGARRNIYYPATRTLPASTPGRITTLVGGLCDGLRGPDVSVDPGDLAVDDAGRIFWVDLGWTAHLNGAPYVRVLDTDGIVRTLGNVGGPAEGRLARDLAIADGLIKLAPDQQGGVYYSWSTGNTFAAAQWQGWPWDAGDDLPQWTLIGHFRADGSHEFVSGVRGRTTWTNGDPEQRNDGGPYRSASFGDIEAMVVDAEGNLYVADGDGRITDGSRVYNRRDPSTADGTYTAGESPQGTGQRLVRFLNRSNHDVTFYRGTPWQITVAKGRVGTIAGPPVGTPRNAGIPTGAQKYYAGTISPTPGSPVPAPQADIGFVSGMVIDSEGNLRLLEYDSNDDGVKIVHLNLGSTSRTVYGSVAAAGRVTQVGGTSAGYGGDGGPVKDAAFYVVSQGGWFWGGIAMDRGGNLYVSDTWNQRIRRVTPSGIVSTVAGTGVAAFNGDGLPGDETMIAYPMGIAVLPDGRPIFADWQNSEIRTIDADGIVRNVAGTQSLGNCNDGAPVRLSETRAGWSAPYGVPRNVAYTAGANLGTPRHAVEDSKGNVYVADPDLGVVRRIAPDGTVEIVAGTMRRCQSSPPSLLGVPMGCAPPESDTGDGGAPAKAVLQQPGYLLLDRYDNLYISSPDAIRYVNFSSRTMRIHDVPVVPGTITTLLRLDPDVRTTDAIPPNPLTGAPCDLASLCSVEVSQYVGLGEMALDDDGTLYVSNLKQNQVMALDWCGDLTVVAGNGVPSQPQADNGDGGPALAAAVSPHGLAWDRRRDLLFIVDVSIVAGGPQSVRVVNLGTKPQSIWSRVAGPGEIETYAGGAPCSDLGWACTYGDGARARDAAFGAPTDVQVSEDGRVFVNEMMNRIRVISPEGIVGTVAGVTPDVPGSGGIGSWFFGVGGVCGDGGVAHSACLGGAAGISLTSRGDMLVTEFSAGRLRRIHDVLHAPLRPPAPVLKGAGYRFTQGTRLGDPAGNELFDPTIAFDTHGRAVVMASALLPSTSVLTGATPFGCDIWQYQPNDDGAGHDRAVFTGTPDGPYQVPGIHVKGGCSLALAPPGGSFPVPPGDRQRISYVSGPRGFQLTNPGYVPNVVSGASRDGGSTFLSSPAGLAAAHVSLTNAFVAPANADDFYMSYAGTSGSSQVSSIAVAKSTGGTEYAAMGDAVTFTYPNAFALEYTFLNTPVVAPDGTLYVPFYYSQCVNPRLTDCVTNRWGDEQFKVAMLRPGVGQTWKVSDPLFSYPCTRGGSWAADPWCFGFHGLPQIAVDRAGTVYAVWDDSHHTYFAHSEDGLRWSAPRRIDRGLSMAGYATIVAGDAGHVAIAFYGTRLPGRNFSTPWLQWAVYLTESMNADTQEPAWVQTAVTDYSAHSGALCQSPCEFSPSIAGTGEAGTYFAMAMNPLDGRVTIAYSESRGAGGHGVRPAIVLVRQCDGPSLLTSPIKAVDCAAGEAEAGAAPPKLATACPPQARDRTGDASWESAPAGNLDITSYGVARAGDDIVTDIEVKEFSSLPPVPASGSPPATGMTWTGFWRSGPYRYWMQAATPASDAARNDPALMQYRWGVVTSGNALSPVGNAVGRVSGNHILMTVPALVVGDPQPGTLLWDLHARSDVVTGATPETAVASPVAQQHQVDGVTTATAYDPALRCELSVPQPSGAPGGSLLPSLAPFASPAASPLPLPLAVPGAPVTPAAASPSPLDLGARDAIDPASAALGPPQPPALTDTSWVLRLMRDDAAHADASAGWRASSAPQSRAANSASPRTGIAAIGPLPTCSRRPPVFPPDPPKPAPPRVLPAIAVAVAPPPPPPVIEGAPGPANAPAEAPAPAQALQNSFQQSQQMTFQSALAPEEQEEPQVALQNAIDEARKGQVPEEYSMVAKDDRAEDRLWQLMAGGITVAAGVAFALARGCLAFAGQGRRRRDRRGG